MKPLTQLYFALFLVFILGVKDGRVALWKDGQPEPVKVFPCRAAMLPPEARSALEKGIRIESMEDLEELAENYLS